MGPLLREAFRGLTIRGEEPTWGRQVSTAFYAGGERAGGA
jgi:hypothetical protein